MQGDKVCFYKVWHSLSQKQISSFVFYLILISWDWLNMFYIVEQHIANTIAEESWSRWFLAVFWLGSVKLNAFIQLQYSVSDNVELCYQIVTRTSRIGNSINSNNSCRCNGNTNTNTININNNNTKIPVLKTFLYHRQVLDAWRWCPTQEPMMRSSPTTAELIKLSSYFRINKCLFIDLFLIRIYAEGVTILSTY